MAKRRAHRRARAGGRRTSGQRARPFLPKPVRIVAAVAVTALIVGAAVLASNPLAGANNATPTAADAVSSSHAPSATPQPAPSATQQPAPVTPTAAGLQPRDGIQCDATEQVTYHVHAHLAIRVDGVGQMIPADVGRYPACFYWLHTHTVSGIIHVEAPAAATFTLGQFFAVWGKPLSAQQVADSAVPAGEAVFAFVDGQAWSGLPADIPLKNLEVIEIQVGATPLTPLGYTFPPDYEVSPAP